MLNLITIKSFDVKEVHKDTNSPYTDRKYAVDNSVVSTLKGFNDEKKGSISKEEISNIKPEFDGNLAQYKEKVTLKTIIKKLAKLSGLNKNGQFSEFSVSPDELEIALKSLDIDGLEKQAKEMEELLGEQKNIIDDQNEQILNLKEQINTLVMENNAYKKVNEALISGTSFEECESEMKKIR